jgi:type II secretory pathway component PulF
MALRPLLRSVRIVGNHYRDAAAKAVHNALTKGEKLSLELEPTNEFDPYAVKVIAGGEHIAYIPRDISAMFYVSGVEAVEAVVTEVAQPKAGKSGVTVLIDVGLNEGA